MELNGREAPSAPGAASGVELSEREHEILRLVATGAGNKQIAQQLVISPNTVKVHLRNIFSKIGVATRTEAALYAVRTGLVKVAPEALPAEEDLPATPSDATVPTDPTAQPADGASVVAAGHGLPARARDWHLRGVVWLLSALTLAAALALGLMVYYLKAVAEAPTPTPAETATPRWQNMAAMPAVLSDFATTTYGSQIYLTGGDGAGGVSAATERFDPATNQWAGLAPKPVPVADAQAAVIGGLIYVPGGRTAEGKLADNLEVFDPRQNKWEERAHLPRALSGYALVAFEGRLLLFGGWDGTDYRAEAYAYSPDQDAWTALTSMPAPRAFAGAAVATGRVYVIGGMDKNGGLTRNDEYSPENEGTALSPWNTRAALPGPRYKMGIIGLADIVHVVGGAGATSQLAALKYFRDRDRWEAFDVPPTDQLDGLGLAAVDSTLHLLGGRQNDQAAPTAQHLTYQAIYTIEIPIMH